MERKKHTLLVVDDEPDIVRSVQLLLRREWNVLGTTRAVDAIKLMEENEVHVVMSDQRMPEMTGVEFLKKVRGEHPEAIRLLFTGYADIHAVIEAINQGNVYRYITKPWDPDELQSILREAADRFDLMCERDALLHQLETKNAELETANAELLNNVTLKTAFIQVASHELRTPLAILLGLSKLAVAVPDVPPFARDVLARIDKASQRLHALVDQIITMLSAGQYSHTLNRQPTDVAALLHDAADDVRPFIDLRKQTLTEQWPADLGLYELDAGIIHDSLNHLLLNAIKFTPDNGTITLAGRRLDDGGLEIRVIDSGDGMTPDVIEHLFEPFFTGFDVSRHSSGKFEYGKKGLGLGLSVVKAFVTLHGGQVTGESEVGRGSTFTIRLPQSA